MRSPEEGLARKSDGRIAAKRTNKNKSKSDSNRSILDKRNKHSHGKIERSETENNCFDQEEQSKSEERIYPQ